MRSRREVLIEEFGYYDKNYEDKGGKNEKERCDVCGRLTETFFRCKHCGKPFTNSPHYGETEYWDQTDPKYTDTALRKFAENAVKYLLEDEYKQNYFLYNKNTVKINHRKNKNWGEWEGRTELTEEGLQLRNTLYLPMKTLRNKKECLDTVAHETAHASPKNWDLRMISKRRSNYRTGHHQTFQKDYQRYKQKLKIRFPDYKYD